MSHFSVLVSVTALCSVCLLNGLDSTWTWAQEQSPTAVQIDAPDRLSTKAYAKPSRDSEIIGIALHRGIYEVSGTSGEFVEIVMPDSGTTGHVLKAHTIPWAAPKAQGLSPEILWTIVIGVTFFAVVGMIVAWTRAKKKKVAEVRAASIPASIKRAEELFRAGDYAVAVREFKSYLDLQGGDVRNPDVYRRISVCYQNVGESREAARAWEKMRDLGGLKGMEDYALGVSLMMSLGKESEAAQIYEQLLETEVDEAKRLDIHKTLYHTYRRLKDAPSFLRHGVALMASDGGKAILGEIVSFLVSEGETAAALEANNEKIIAMIAQELLEEKVRSPEAARIYLKALEYNRTDKRLHGILSQIYAEDGDYRKAVSELTILYQLDKGQNELYLEHAARLYVENSRVQEALAEGNPLIIKKLAQIYLARSEVNPDAVAVYEKVLEFQPKAVGINKMLSTVYLTRGDLRAYMERLRLLHEIDGKNHDYLTELAKCIIDNNLVDQTIKEGNRDLNSKILKQLIKSGASDDGAVALFEKLIKYEPNSVPIRTALGSAYEKRKQYDLFIEHALVLLAAKSDDSELAEKVAAIAIEHNLVEKVARDGAGRVVELTAAKLTGRSVTEAESRQILEKLVKGSGSQQHGAIGPRTGAEAPREVTTSRAQPLASAKQSVTKELKPSKPQGLESSPRAAAGPTGKGGSSPPHTASQPTTRLEAAALAAAETSSGSPQPQSPGPSSQQLQSAGPAASDSVNSRTAIDFSELPPADQIPQPNIADPVRKAQFVNITDQSIGIEAKAVTTFVSGYSTGMVSKYQPEELFLPAAGGLAYKDLEVLFADGWSNFHLGIEVRTSRHVLLRVFRRDLLDALSLRELVTQVSELGFTIVHDAILPLHETVTGPASARGLVHPFFPKNLEQVLNARKLELREALILFDRILGALSYAHNYKGLDGKLHRTYHLHMHPSQILVSENLTDCRIASLGYSQVYRNLTRATRPRWQEPGMNPATMPPEFFRSRAAGVRERQSEVYSLGALLCVMVTGEYPFEGPAFDDFKFQHMRIHAAPPSSINRDLPDWIDRLVLRCLQKDPEKRWDSVTQLHQEFRRGLTDMGMH